MNYFGLLTYMLFKVTGIFSFLTKATLVGFSNANFLKLFDPYQSLYFVPNYYTFVHNN